MKNVLAILAILIGLYASAQQSTILIRDKFSSRVVVGANVHVNDREFISDERGQVTFHEPKPGDSIVITATGYHTVVMPVIYLDTTQEILLEPLPQMLEEVVIDRMRSASRDSSSWRRVLERRIARQKLNERRLGVFVQRGEFDPYWPRHVASGSTAALATVNLNKLVALLRKKESLAPESRVWTEQDKLSLEQWFTPAVVTGLTGLKGDALQYFMIRYRPEKADLSELSEYQVLLHIKNSYKMFLAEPTEGDK